MKCTTIVGLAIMCMIVTGCKSPMAMTGAGSTDGDTLVSFGSVVSDTAEVGITAVSFDGPDKSTYAAGPYAMYLIPMPEDIGKDWQPFTGGAVLATMDGDLDFVPKLVAGIIYKPQDSLSPVYFAEKAFPSEDVDSPNIGARSDDLFHWFGLRYRFK